MCKKTRFPRIKLTYDFPILCINIELGCIFFYEWFFKVEFYFYISIFFDGFPDRNYMAIRIVLIYYFYNVIIGKWFYSYRLFQ